MAKQAGKIGAASRQFKQKPLYGEIKNALNPVQPIQFTGDYDRQQTWEEMDELYNLFATGMVDTAQYLNVLVNYIKTNTTDKQAELSVIEKGIARDLNDFTNELLAIRNSHRTKSGVITEPDDLAFCLDIFNQYTVFKDRMTVTLHNYALELTAMSAELQAQLNTGIADAENVSMTPIVTESKDD